MPGTFSKTNRPKRPGAYFNFQALATPTIQPSAAGTVCIPLTHDWGPYKTPTYISSLAEWVAVFGPTTTTAGYKAVYQAFMGEGLPGRGGAGRILVYRNGGSSAAKATYSVKQTNGTTPALVVNARYEGAYGNNLSVTVEQTPGAATNDLVLKLNGVEVERYTHALTDITALGAAVNLSSSWVTCTVSQSGTALERTTNSLASGANGTTTLAAADYAAALSAVEPYRFGVFAYSDLQEQALSGGATATDLLASHKTWAVALNAAGKRFLTVVGGALDEVVATAVARSATLNSSDHVNVGVGGVVDSQLGVLSTSQLSSRIAGILAAFGEDRSLTFARLAGVTARNFCTSAQILTAYDGGVCVLSLDSVADAPVRIEKGLTTYLSGDSNKPYLIYRNPKYVRTTHGIETELTEWAEANVIGQLATNENTTTYVVAHAKSVIAARETAGVLQPGSTVGIDQDPPPNDTDEFLQLAYGVKFGRSIEQVFNTVTIS